ncbi:hypothetical protein A5727_15905 [Mycobacterium sp. ACS4331]|nr:hypothetical protein A5727_15905 [Mycobacterium sp. ACS4331]
MAVRTARSVSITNGTNTIAAVSAMAICAVTDSTGWPSSPSDCITGRASAAEEEAISTANRRV